MFVVAGASSVLVTTSSYKHLYMPSQAFVKAKRVGRWFEGLVDPVLSEMGFQVIDTDKRRYNEKKGSDRIVKIFKNGRWHVCKLEMKFDVLSEQTGNVAVDLDSIKKSDSPIWIYGLPEGNRIDCYSMLLSDLAPFAQNWPTKCPGGEFGGLLALIPKHTFLGQKFVHKFKTIELVQA